MMQEALEEDSVLSAIITAVRGVPSEYLEYVIYRGLADMSDDANRLDWVREARRVRETDHRSENQ